MPVEGDGSISLLTWDWDKTEYGRCLWKGIAVSYCLSEAGMTYYHNEDIKKLEILQNQVGAWMLQGEWQGRPWNEAGWSTFREKIIKEKLVTRQMNNWELNQRQLNQWAIQPVDNSTCGQFNQWTTELMDNSTSGQWTSWQMNQWQLNQLTAVKKFILLVKWNATIGYKIWNSGQWFSHHCAWYGKIM